jgi:hypothetical protein
MTPESVVIDGVRYVPVSQAHVTVPALEDAFMGLWWGATWRDHIPDAPGRIYVSVTDDEQDGGETVTDFIARLINALPKEA